MAQRAEHQIQIAEVLFSVFNGVTFCGRIFLFSHSKTSDAITVYCQFYVFVKETQLS